LNSGPPNKQHLVYLRERFNEIVNEYESQFYSKQRFAEKKEQAAKAQKQMKEHKQREKRFQ
jgi:hypothetical protein